jgi:hypothetical protein
VVARLFIRRNTVDKAFSALQKVVEAKNLTGAK